MMRLLPGEVVAAYEATGRIPIRLAWTTTDDRGGCAIDTLAESRGITTNSLRSELDNRYETGFLTAWDSDPLRSARRSSATDADAAQCR